MSKTRMFLIEDNRLLRERIGALVNSQTDMKIVSTSGLTDNVASKARTSKAEVILIDLGFRSHDSLDTIKSVLTELPEMKVIGIGLAPTQSNVASFVAVGAAGFILKGASEEDFLGTIRSVAGGTKILPPSLAGSLFSHVFARAAKEGRSVSTNAIPMTKREREIMALIADGLSNKDIAQLLNIGLYTVKSHVHSILKKLALRSRLQISALTHGDGKQP